MTYEIEFAQGDRYNNDGLHIEIKLSKLPEKADRDALSDAVQDISDICQKYEKETKSKQ